MKNWLFYISIVTALPVFIMACTPRPVPGATPTPQSPATGDLVAPLPEPKITVQPATTPEPRPKAATETPYFQGKTIEILSASGVGGGTDATARAIAVFFPQYLPGEPKVVVRNQPGAGGVVAANSFFAKAKPDGLSLLHGSSSLIAYQQRGRDIVRFDFLKMAGIGNIGGAGAGGLIAIHKRAIPRLKDPRAEAVVMGTREGTETSNLIPLYGREFLGWNVRWLLGFSGTAETVLAFRRGEVDMFLDNGPNIKTLAEEGLAEPLAQIGVYKYGKFTRRPDFPQVPTFVEVLGDKKPEGLPWEGYLAAIAPITVFKFTVAAPGTPDNIVKILVDGYERMKNAPKFNDLLTRVLAEAYEIDTGQETTRLIKDALSFGPEAAAYPDTLLKKYGVIK